MKYIKLQNINIELSSLGFGTMRLPINQDDTIETKQATDMISYGFDNGINYIDTAYPYHNGQSEILTGEILKNGYRDKVYLATKLPSWNIHLESDFDKYLNEQLSKLQVDQIDFYLLHCMNVNFWDQLNNFDLFRWAERIKKDGRIKYFGFSIHDSFPLFKTIIDSYDWDFCQIQYNYMNEKVQVGTEGLKYAGSKNIPVMAMEPLLGGTLANFPDHIQKLCDDANINPVELAFKWLLDKPEISCILSGMNNIDQVKQNIKIADSNDINSLTESESLLIELIIKEFGIISPIPCTKCNYCIPCPVNINIPELFGMFNALSVHKRAQDSLNKNLYSNIPIECNANACVNCKQCEKHCPQGIPISNWMPKVHAGLLLNNS